MLDSRFGCAGLVGVWIGTMLYNVSCITPAILCTLPMRLPLPLLSAVQHWAVLVPNVIAGSLFVNGSYSSWATSARTWAPAGLLKTYSTDGFWGNLLYLLVRPRHYLFIIIIHHLC